MTEDLDGRLRDVPVRPDPPAAQRDLQSRASRRALVPRWSGIAAFVVVTLVTLGLAASVALFAGRPTVTQGPDLRHAEPFVSVVSSTGSCADPSTAGAGSPPEGAVTVSPGDVVFIGLVVDESSSGGRYPWEGFTSSDPSILRSIPFCPPTPRVSVGLPRGYAAFLAIADGGATISAKVSSGWQAPSSAPTGYITAVDVVVRIR